MDGSVPDLSYMLSMNPVLVLTRNTEASTSRILSSRVD